MNEHLQNKTEMAEYKQKTRYKAGSRIITQILWINQSQNLTGFGKPRAKNQAVPTTRKEKSHFQ
jgi:hypothetical protein